MGATRNCSKFHAFTSTNSVMGLLPNQNKKNEYKKVASIDLIEKTKQTTTTTKKTNFEMTQENVLENFHPFSTKKIMMFTLVKSNH